MAQKRKDGRAYLQETQPEVWKTASEMASQLTNELMDLKWEERIFIFDQFVRELVEELMGPDGLSEISLLPIAELMPADDTSRDDAAQLVASIRSILTAALHDLPDGDFDTLTTITESGKALVLLISELDEHNDAARTWFAREGVEAALSVLKPLVGVTVLMLADRAGGNTIEPLASTEKMRAMLDETWGEELS